MATSIDPTGDLLIPAGRGVPHEVCIPASELHERFSRSSGPGGQSVNTADSRVELTWDLVGSAALTAAQRHQLLAQLGSRLSNGTLTVSSSEHRAQLPNRVAARARLRALIATALVPATPRRATRPSRAAKQARMDAKRRRADVKSTRGRVHDD